MKKTTTSIAIFTRTAPAVWAALLAVVPSTAAGQAAPPPNPPGMNEGRIHRDFRVEKEALGACARFNFGGLVDCGQTLVLGQPMHLALASLAPQDGFGAGLAFVEHKNFKNEVRSSYDIDAMATGNGSWRAGGYAKFYRQPSGFTFRAAPLLNVFSQSVSLKRVDFYGLGPNTTPLTHTTYQFAENITGANIIIPSSGFLYRKAGLGFLGEINARIPRVGSGSDAVIPPITRLFTEATAPGLTLQTPFLQTSEGIRMVPIFPKDPIRLNYLVQFQQFVSPRSSVYSFRRFHVDLNHEIPLYNFLPKKLKEGYFKARTPVVQYQGPDDCTAASVSRNIAPQRAATADAKFGPDSARPCPIVSTTDKLEGSLSFRAIVSESFADRGSVVPFFFSPTLGGSDINGTAMLASYPDYRFRGPDLLLFRGTIEHSLGKLPIGGIFSIDEGKIGERRGDISLNHLRHTFSAGFTVHAGGLPVFDFMFAWGGHEGTHALANVNRPPGRVEPTFTILAMVLIGTLPCSAPTA